MEKRRTILDSLLSYIKFQKSHMTQIMNFSEIKDYILYSQAIAYFRKNPA